MAFEKNTQILAEWAQSSAFNGPNGMAYISRLRALTRPEDEPERVDILKELLLYAMGCFETVPLWPKGQVPGWRAEYRLQNEPEIAFFPAVSGGAHGCVLVAPGGGYSCIAAGSEGFPIVWRLVNAGFHCALLNYRVKPYSQYRSLEDARRAVRLLRAKAGEWGILPGHIAMLGGSAGGNLTCLTCVHGDGGNPDAADPVERQSSRPDAGLVMYGCFTAVSWPGSDAFMRMREDEPDFRMPQGGLVSVYMDEQRRDKYFFSPEKWVTPDTPPFFLWQTADMDDPRNMMCFAKELADAGVRFEAHIYPFGPHGMALADGTGLGPADPHVARWMDQAVEWLKLYAF